MCASLSGDDTKMKEVLEDRAVKYANAILETMDECDLDPMFCFAALSHAFCRIASDLGYTPDTFRQITSQMSRQLEE